MHRFERLSAMALAAAALCGGCVNLIWPLITDNAGQGSEVVNTKGKAYVGKFGANAIVGGRRFEHLSFVDQSETGHHQLTAYELEDAAGTYQAHSDTYCNPDWTGCAWLTNDYTPPGDCSFDAPGVRLNLDCLESFAVGLCFSSRSSGECGRALRTHGLSASEVQSLLSMGQEIGRDKLRFPFSARNTSITLQSANGGSTNLKVAGVQEVTLNLHNGRCSYEVGPTMAQNIRTLSSKIDGGFKDGVMVITYGGVTRSFGYSALAGDFYRNRLARNGM